MDEAAADAAEAPRRFFGSNRHADALNALLQATTSRRANFGLLTPRPWHHGDGEDDDAPRPRRRGLFSSRNASAQPVQRQSGGMGNVLLMGGVMALGIAASTLLFRNKQPSDDAARTQAAVDAAAQPQLPAQPSRTSSPAPMRPPPRPSSDTSRGPSPARERLAAAAAGNAAQGRARPPAPPPAPPARKEHAFTATVRLLAMHHRARAYTLFAVRGHGFRRAV